MTPPFLMPTASPSSWKWAAAASASPAWPPRLSRTTTTGHHLARRHCAFTVVLCPISPDRFPDVKAAAEALCRVAGCGRGRDAGRPQRTPRRHVCRLGNSSACRTRVTIGDRALKEGVVEYQHRRDSGDQGGRGGDRRVVAVQTGCMTQGVTTGSHGEIACCPVGWTWTAINGGAKLGWRPIEEPLMDSVRTALSNADPQRGPPFPVCRRPSRACIYCAGSVPWDRLKKKTDFQTRKEFLQTVWYESKRRAGYGSGVGADSGGNNFRKYAVSIVGAAVHAGHAVLDSQHWRWRRRQAFHMQTNLRFGCVILRHYLDRENGDLFAAGPLTTARAASRNTPMRCWGQPVVGGFSAK